MCAPATPRAAPRRSSAIRCASPAQQGEAKSIWYGGGRLARDLTLPALRHAWRQAPGDERAAVAEWNPWTAQPPRDAAEQQAELEERGVMWHRASADIERMRRQLRAAGSDPAAGAQAAREAAGVLGAWSLALEGARPGPLARGARQLARSAEQRAHARALPRRPVARGSGLALFMLAAGKHEGTFGWALVGRELGLLGRELARNHRLRGETQRAEEIETQLLRELEQWRAGTEHGAAPAGPLDPDAKEARRAREPLASPERGATSPAAEADAEAARRLTDSTRRRPRRGR